MSNGKHMLWYNHCAKEYVEALPLGNGKIGTMIFGNPQNEKVGLNLDTLWSGYSNYFKVDNKVEHFNKLRSLSLDNKQIESSNYIEKNFTGDNCQWYLQQGVLKISFRDKICAKKYRRQLDISKAVYNCCYTSNDTEYCSEAFVSAVDEVFIYKYTAIGKKKLSFDIMIDSELKSEVCIENNKYILDGYCPSELDTDTKGRPVTKYLDGIKEGIKFRACFKILTDGTLSSHKLHLTVENATEATIIFTSESNFEDWKTPTFTSKKDYRKICSDRIEAAEKIGYKSLINRHVQDYSSYYNRVDINLGASNKDNVPTNRRLHEFMYNNTRDNDLYCLLFNYGRYLTISASRPGSQAMTLQGIWTFKLCSPWKSNYTTNINTQMNYWPTLICSLQEMYSPLIEMIKSVSESGKEVAKNYYGCSGFCCHHNVDIWRICTPSQGNPVWSFWSLAGAWFCRHLFEYYEYTDDLDYLRNIAFPIIKSASQFCSDMLVEDGSGYLIFAPSTSPENEYMIDNNKCSISKTSYMTMEIVKDLFEICIKTYNIIKLNEDFKNKLIDKIDKLLPLKISSDGSLYEWYDDVKGCDKHHRHISHLYALYPSDLISIKNTPNLAGAAVRTLELRGDNGTGWSLGWKINCWARLGNKEKVIKLINNQLRYIPSKYKPGKGGTFINMFDAHPPFQIDGNFGATSGIAQALMQSFDNDIYILPALPDIWENGYITGLSAKHNIKIDIFWSNHTLSKVVLYGKGTVNLHYNDSLLSVKIDEMREISF